MTLLLKLILTPLFIAGTSMASRRWGPGVSGWLVGLPLTSGPLTVFFALDQGPRFAANASAGMIAGTISVAAFCLVYSRLAEFAGWAGAAGTGLTVYFAITAILRSVDAPLGWTVAAVLLFLTTTLPAMPAPIQSRSVIAPPRWDIPARVLAATSIVVILTTVAPSLGPRLSGLLATFPLFATTLAVFTHSLSGAGPAASLLRGVVVGLYAYVGFFLVITVTIEPWGTLAAFAAAIATAIAIQAASLRLIPARTTTPAAQTLP